MQDFDLPSWILKTFGAMSLKLFTSYRIFMRLIQFIWLFQVIDYLVVLFLICVRGTKDSRDGMDKIVFGDWLMSSADI